MPVPMPVDLAPSNPAPQLSQILYHMEDAKKQQWMKVNGIPKIAVWLVINGNIRKFDDVYMKPFLAIGQGLPEH